MTDTNGEEGTDLNRRRGRAEELATRMPLVHFPANTRFDMWSVGWGGLKSRAALGLTCEEGKFGDLRGKHVFAYAGPPCFYKAGCVGDAVIYFDPLAEAGHQGGATPFDSGSLEPPDARLQPWAKAPVEERWDFFQRCSMPLAGWRARFADWLSFSYDEPDRYLSTIADRYKAGEPDRLDPPALLEHNGTRGLDKKAPEGCADRRAWTWEVRIEGQLSFEKVRALHVPFDALEQALDLAERLSWTTSFKTDVEALPPEVPASYEALYQESEPLLRKLIG